VGTFLFYPWHSVSLVYIFNLFHSFIFDSGGVDIHFEVMPVWHSRYSH